MDIERGTTRMSMHVNLSQEMQSYIKSKVSAGFYANATEVIRDAIRRMQASDRENAALQAAAPQGTRPL
jgi:antitoxin ParD1/3/4